MGWEGVTCVGGKRLNQGWVPSSGSNGGFIADGPEGSSSLSLPLKALHKGHL